ncbi:MAG: Ribose transport system permease protein RbsC [Firmicutes bacterium ADurb.Bin182]|nr:MAG: Ribose transport system permease protein RbsC [Firmicutes bacterium ADurb.Bin182]
MSINDRIQALKTNKVFGRFYGLAVLLLLVLIFWSIFMLITPGNFGSLNNMYFYFQSSIIYSVGACGFYFIVVMGLFDFSIGANVILSSIVGVILSKQYGYAGLLIGCMLCGALIGFLNGFLYIRLKVPSMIVTVGLMLIYESIAYFAAGGQKQTLDQPLRAFGSAPWNIILAVAAFLLASFIIKYTKVGTYCYAIGSNEFVASNMGINVNKYKLLGFILLHFFVGIMAVLTVSYGTSMTALTGMASMSRNFTPLMGCFLAVAFKKHGTPILAIIIGGMIISIIFNGFVALGAPTTIQNVVTGVALLTIVALTLKSEKGAVVK